MKPQLVVLAGPNGAGKSTFYDVFLSESELLWLNADLFAAETGIDSFDAARILDETRARLIRDGIGFITETVFSDPHGSKLTMLSSAVEAGYEVTLIYIGVSNADLLARRVDQRIARGGHDVPRDRIASRFERSLRNLKSALPLVTTAKLYDNSDVDEPFRHIATFDRGSQTLRGKGRLPAWTRGIVPAARRKRKR